MDFGWLWCVKFASSIDNKCTIWCGMLIMGKAVFVGGEVGSKWEIFIPSFQFSSEPETALKIGFKISF